MIKNLVIHNNYFRYISVIIRRYLLMSFCILSFFSCKGESESVSERYSRRIIEIEYKNHSYLILRNIKDDQIIHDPDCKCKDKE